tara:strand:- start:696 stop:1466 length:771 start_codon:yes stop_codon:yes gene_type:complete
MKLYSRIYGDNIQDLIIIHGLFGMSDNWNSLGRQFAKYYKVHLIDLRNHGRSPHAEEFNYNVMCEDIFEYVEANNIKKPILLGHSLGGKVAMKFAFTYPENIKKLVIADIAPRKYNTDYHQNLLTIISEINLKNYTKRNEIDIALSSFIKEPAIRSFLLKNLFRDIDNNFAWRFNLKGLLNQLNNIQDDSFVVGACNIPTNFMRGGNSNYITHFDEHKINTHFSNSSITTIEGAGHWLHAEKPERFYNEVIKFCLM